jgi:hypothetical protein
VSCPGHLLPPGDPVPLVQEAEWAPGAVWTGAENLAFTGIQSPDHPAPSQSLYRLSYSTHVSVYNSYRILSSYRTFLYKAMIATEGKQRGYLNEWSLCSILMVLKTGGQDQSVCL